MKHAIYLLVIIFVASCGKKSEPATETENTYLKTLSETIETYEDGQKETGTVEYAYEVPDDYFWKKAIFKDDKGEIEKTIEREFDVNRFPSLEITRDADNAVTSTIALSYYADTRQIKEKIYYDGEALPENKKMGYKYYYENGRLIAEEVERYAGADFTNSEGNNVSMSYKMRYFPAPDSRPQGSYQTAYFTENYTRFFTERDKEKSGLNLKIGDVYQTEKTEFDQSGKPKYKFSEEPECCSALNEEWFAADKDGIGNLLSITGFSNEKLDSHKENNTKIVFEYDDKAQLRKIIEFKYNEQTKQFDKVHDTKTFAFYGAEYLSDFNAVEADILSEHFCLGEKIFKVTHTKVVKFADGEKMIERHTGSYSGEYTGKLPEMKLQSRRIIKYEAKKFE